MKCTWKENSCGAVTPVMRVADLYVFSPFFHGRFHTVYVRLGASRCRKSSHSDPSGASPCGT
jgi:hypothetical protein